jgi:hypothetical protein
MEIAVPKALGNGTVGLLLCQSPAVLVKAKLRGFLPLTLCTAEQWAVQRVADNTPGRGSTRMEIATAEFGSDASRGVK